MSRGVLYKPAGGWEGRWAQGPSLRSALFASSRKWEKGLPPAPSAGCALPPRLFLSL
jgi:hypothetical protein